MNAGMSLNEAVKIYGDPTELVGIVRKQAERDLAAARREHTILICRTLRGNLDVAYSDGTYKIATMGDELYTGAKSGAVEALMNLYAIAL